MYFMSSEESGEEDHSFVVHAPTAMAIEGNES